VRSTGLRPKVVVTGGARGVVGCAGTRLLADIADSTGLTRGFTDAVGQGRRRRSAHDPGRVAVDLAVLIADGGEAIADLAVLREQPRLFGAVASDATAWSGSRSGSAQAGSDGVRCAETRQQEAADLQERLLAGHR
jgi:hypothetical protein